MPIHKVFYCLIQLRCFILLHGVVIRAVPMVVFGWWAGCGIELSDWSWCKYWLWKIDGREGNKFLYIPSLPTFSPPWEVHDAKYVSSLVGGNVNFRGKKWKCGKMLNFIWCSCSCWELLNHVLVKGRYILSKKCKKHVASANM